MNGPPSVIEHCMGEAQVLSQAPPSFICPVTLDLMEDPVIVLDSMQTVSRAAARQWFSLGHNRCPVTNVTLKTCKMIPNRALRAAVLEWRQSCRKETLTAFKCPIANDVFQDPVVMVGSMQTVDRTEAEKVLSSGQRRCPITQMPIKNGLLIPNFALKAAIEEWGSICCHQNETTDSSAFTEGTKKKLQEVFPNSKCTSYPSMGHHYDAQKHAAAYKGRATIAMSMVSSVLAFLAVTALLLACQSLSDAQCPGILQTEVSGIAEEVLLPSWITSQLIDKCTRKPIPTVLSDWSGCSLSDKILSNTGGLMGARRDCSQAKYLYAHPLAF